MEVLSLGVGMGGRCHFPEVLGTTMWEVSIRPMFGERLSESDIGGCQEKENAC